MTTRIPRAALFGNPTRARGQIDPTGRHLSWLAPVDGVLNLWVAPREAPSQARPLTRLTGRPISDYTWSTRGDHVLFLRDADGDENHHVFAVSLDGSEVRDLTPFEGVQARFVRRLPDEPDIVVVALNDRVPQLHDVWRVHVGTGERTELQRNDLGALDFTVDRSGRVRAAIVPTEAGGMALLVPRPELPEGWAPLRETTADDGLYVGPVGVVGDELLWLDAAGRDTAALHAIDLATGHARLIAASEEADVAEVLASAVDARPLAWKEDPGLEKWHALDDGVAADLARLEALTRGGGFDVSSSTDDDRVWVVYTEADCRPGAYHVYDRATGELELMFTTRPELDAAPLAPMEVLRFTARDGLPLVAYLTRPVGAQGPGPLVLLVHGGPWARDDYGYHPYHQWLANRGYSVLAVNFRGSLGFGKRFVNAADREWGGKMHDDLLDGVAHAVALGVADPARVAIMGGSYGGYATLWGLTATPEAFCCGIDIVGPSNLETLMSSFPEYWKPLLDTFKRRVGDPSTPEGLALLRDRSPLHRADRIVRPLLIAQGANDPRVKQAESDQIVDALRAHGIPVTYALFPDEGHGFARPENSLAFVAAAERFLARWLGGWSEPWGDVVERSSLVWAAGREHLSEGDASA